MYLIVQTAIVYTYRPIIYKRYIHHGREQTVLDFVCLIRVLYLLEESLVEFFGTGSACRLVEAGSAFLHRS